MRKSGKKEHIFFHYQEQDFSFRNRSECKTFISALFKKEKKHLKELHYVFCTDAYLLAINKEFLNHNFFTDIITFPLSDTSSDIVGEIYISIDRVRENAITYKTTFTKELHRVIFHGALHLCGFKDKTKLQSSLMRKKEEEYLKSWFKHVPRKTVSLRNNL